MAIKTHLAEREIKLTAEQKRVLSLLAIIHTFSPQAWVSFADRQSYVRGNVCHCKGKTRKPSIPTCRQLHTLKLADLNHFVGYRITDLGMKMWHKGELNR